MTLLKQLFSSVLLMIIAIPVVMADVSEISEVDFSSLNKTVTSESLNDKIVYVDFWASWCKPCFKSFPWMAEMQDKYADDGLKIIGVNLDKEESLSASFLEKAPANFDLVFDSEATLAELFKVKAMPSSYLFDREGNLAASHMGFQEKKKDLYEKELRILLGLE